MKRGRPREKPTPIEEKAVRFKMRFMTERKVKICPTEEGLIYKASTIIGVPCRSIEIKWDEDDELNGGEFRSKGEVLGRFDIET